MQNFFIGSIIFLSVIAQMSFLPNIFPIGLVPDVVLIFIIVWTARLDFNAVLKWAILGGLMMDLAYSYPIGVSVFSFVVVAFLVNSLSKRFLVPHFGWKFLVLLVIVFLATIIYQIVLIIILGVVRDNNMREVVYAIFSSYLVWKPFYNLLIFVMIYWPIRRLDKIFSYQNQRIIIKKHV